jgi:16S rRNA C1402 (ribose-2'-O) methylase RsmI
MRNIRKNYRKEISRNEFSEDTKKIMRKNEDTFVYVMRNAEKILKHIAKVKDVEFQIVVCNELTTIFHNMTVNFAMGIRPKLASKTEKEKTRYIG